MKVWWVLGWHDYYPDVDNFCASCLTEEEAKEWIQLELTHDRRCDRYQIINISTRL